MELQPRAKRAETEVFSHISQEQKVSEGSPLRKSTVAKATPISVTRASGLLSNLILFHLLPAFGPTDRFFSLKARLAPHRCHSYVSEPSPPPSSCPCPSRTVGLCVPWLLTFSRELTPAGAASPGAPSLSPASLPGS